MIEQSFIPDSIEDVKIFTIIADNLILIEVISSERNTINDSKEILPLIDVLINPSYHCLYHTIAQKIFSAENGLVNNNVFAIFSENSLVKNGTCFATAMLLIVLLFGNKPSQFFNSRINEFNPNSINITQ